MKVLPVACLKDNFAYLLICEQSAQAAVVDPSEAGPVLAALEQVQLPLVAILNTHHHWDHTGGNHDLCQVFPGLKVYGHASDRGRIEGQNQFLQDQETLIIGQLSGTAIHNPGHTSGAVSYHFENALFTGDTLFAAGCGRLFEGSPAQMYASLNQQLGRFPEQTVIYFGHEYTLKNLQFAQAVEPENPEVERRIQAVKAALVQGKTTTPSTLGEERQTNPFLRCEIASVVAAAQAKAGAVSSDAVEVFRALRAWKDHF